MEEVVFEKWKTDNIRDLALLDYHYYRGRPAYNKKGKVDKTATAKIRRVAKDIRNQLIGKNLTKKTKGLNLNKEQYQKIEKHFEMLKKTGKLQGLK